MTEFIFWVFILGLLAFSVWSLWQEQASRRGRDALMGEINDFLEKSRGQK